MARPLRIQFPGALYHVMSRGNERKAIVRDDADREKRLDWLRRTVETYGWRLHAFVLLNNHEHLFVETPEANLSAGMQYLNGSYTSYFNRRHRRSGHLLQGRFKGHLIEEEGHFLEVSRYIHLNPVRAKLVGSPEAYRWSSHPGYVRGSRVLSWVTYDRVLGEFGKDAVAARRAYGRFVRAGIEERLGSPFADAFAGLILGSDRFVGRVRERLRDRPAAADLPQLESLRPRPSLREIVQAVSDEFRCDASQWEPGRRFDDAARAVAAYLGRRHFRYPARDVAAALGYRSHGGVHNAVGRIEGNDRLQRTARQVARRLG